MESTIFEGKSEKLCGMDFKMVKYVKQLSELLLDIQMRTNYIFNKQACAKKLELITYLISKHAGDGSCIELACGRTGFNQRFGFLDVFVFVCAVRTVCV